VSRRIPFLLSVAALASVGCAPCKGVQSSLFHSDGGAVRCVTSEDCPRTGNDTVCITTSPLIYAGACVSCVSTECLRWVETCP